MNIVEQWKQRKAMKKNAESGRLDVVYIVDTIIDNLFEELVDNYKLITGDISPEDEIILGQIKDKLVELSSRFVEGNQT